MLFTKRRGVKLHVYATRKPVALAMAVLAMVARNTLPFVTGISTLVGARRGPFLQTAFFFGVHAANIKRLFHGSQ